MVIPILVLTNSLFIKVLFRSYLQLYYQKFTISSNSIIHFKLKAFVVFPINPIATLRFLLPSSISYNEKIFKNQCLLNE